MGHKWNGREIVDPKHHEKLEHEAATKELVHKQPRVNAEENAYAEYKQAQHLEAAGHHLRSLRLAVSGGHKEDAEKHNALLKMHVQKLGHNPHHPPSAEIQHAAASSKASVSGRNHPADALIAHGPLGKTQREALDCWPMAKADGEVPPVATPSKAPAAAPDASSSNTSTSSSATMPIQGMGNGNAGEGKDAGPQHFNKGSIVKAKESPTSHIPPSWIGVVTAHHNLKVHPVNGAEHHQHYYEISWKTPEGKIVEDFLPQEMLIGRG